VRLTIRGNIARWTGHAGNATAARDQFAELLPHFERGLGPSTRHPDQPRPLDWMGVKAAGNRD
jgi:hypothetical protein